MSMDIDKELDELDAILAAGKNIDPQIKEWILFTCQANGIPELAQKIQLEWNTRYRTVAGRAIHSAMTIRISTKLWERSTPEEKRTTIIHETCHIVAREKYSNSGRIAAHGYEWKHTMRKCGLSPKRCHNINTEGLRRRNGRQARTEYRCRKCSHIYNLSANMVGRIMNKTRSYRCRYCGEPVIFRTIKLEEI